MSDLISRQEAIEAVATVTMSIHLSNVLCDKLLALPSADIEEDVARRIATIIENEQDMRVILKNADRPIGEWVDDCTCSICHWMHEDNNGFALITKYNYCPNCGAWMVKEDGE